MGFPWRTKEDVTATKNLFETTDLTLGEIGDSVGITRKQVHKIVAENYSVEERKSRKVINYSRSKMGGKNPMSGKFGAEHPNYIGIVSDGKGYLMALKPAWFTARKGCKHVFVHTLVMCFYLGLTELPPGMTIHHIDKDPTNNDIDNLALLTMSGHSRLHARERATTIPKGSRTQEGSKRTA